MNFPSPTPSRSAPQTWLAEISKTGYEHASFNEAVVAECLGRGESVTFLASPDHVACLSPGAGCDIVPLPVKPLGGRFHSVPKYLLEMVVATRCLWRARRAGAALTFMSMAPSTLLFVAFLARTGISFSTFVHNELEILAVPTKAAQHGMRNRMLHLAFRLMRNTRVHLRSLTLGGTSFLCRNYPGLNVAHEPLPLNPHASRFRRERDTFAAPVFGLVGTLGDATINANVRELCVAFAGVSTDTRIRLDVIGGRALHESTRQSLSNTPSLDCRFVSAAAQSEYFTALAACDVVLFLSSPDSYSVSASSVIIDAVSLQLEVFSLPCRYAEEVAAKHPVKLFESIEALAAEVIRRGRPHPPQQPASMPETSPTPPAEQALSLRS